MKKFRRTAITAAQDLDTDYNGAFSDIAYDIEKLGYEVTIGEEFKMTIKCVKDEKFMPEIKVNTVEEDGVYYFNADVKFPELKYDDMEFADSVAYWVDDKWKPVAEFITKLSKFGYDPRDWEE